MGSISNYLEDKWVDHALNTAAFTQPTNIYVGLSTADPLDDASGIAEPSGNNYSRVAHNTWDTAASRKTSNTGTITFNQCQTGPWGTITHWFLCDHISNTTWGTNVNLLAHGSLATSKQVVVGNTPSFADDELDISVNTSASTGGWADFIVHEMLDHTFKVGSYTAPTDLYFALYTVAPTDSTNGTECTGNNYSRKQYTGTWSASSGGTSDNDAQILFATPSGTWGTVVAGAALDANTGNNILFWVDVVEQAVGSGDTVDFPAGDFDVSIS